MSIALLAQPLNPPLPTILFEENLKTRLEDIFLCLLNTFNKLAQQKVLVFIVFQPEKGLSYQVLSFDLIKINSISSCICMYHLIQQDNKPITSVNT